MTELIAALKRKIDSDGHMRFDRAQTIYLMFFLYEILECQSEIRDRGSLKYAIKDLLGVLPDAEERGA